MAGAGIHAPSFLLFNPQFAFAASSTTNFQISFLNQVLMADDSGYRSSQEYSGTVEEASIAIPGNAADVAAVVSSGSHTKLDRERRGDLKAAVKAVVSSGSHTKLDRERREDRKAAVQAVVSSGLRAQLNRQGREGKKTDATNAGDGSKDGSSGANKF